MILLTNPFWLIVTDSFLGLVVAAFALFLLVVLIREIVLHLRYRRSRQITRDLRTFVSKHGITMADGGKLREKATEGGKQTSEPDGTKRRRQRDEGKSRASPE